MTYTYIAPKAPQYSLWNSDSDSPPVSIDPRSFVASRIKFLANPTSTGLLIGRMNESSITFDRFDLGKLKSGLLSPTVHLPDDAISNYFNTALITNSEYLVMLNHLQNLISGSMNQNGTFPLLTKTNSTTCVICIIPSTILTLSKITPLPLIPTLLFQSILSDSTVFKSGLVTIDQSRRVLPLLKTDPKSDELPLIGIWINGSITDFKVYIECLAFIHSKCVKLKIGRRVFIIVDVLNKDFYECSWSEDDDLFLYKGQAGIWDEVLLERVDGYKDKVFCDAVNLHGRWKMPYAADIIVTVEKALEEEEEEDEIIDNAIIEHDEEHEESLQSIQSQSVLLLEDSKEEELKPVSAAIQTQFEPPINPEISLPFLNLEYINYLTQQLAHYKRLSAQVHPKAVSDSSSQTDILKFRNKFVYTEYKTEYKSIQTMVDMVDVEIECEMNDLDINPAVTSHAPEYKNEGSFDHGSFNERTGVDLISGLVGDCEESFYQNENIEEVKVVEDEGYSLCSREYLNKYALL